MKSFNVKSNAKRTARKLADAFSGIAVAEPVETSPGAREWFPAVSVIAGVLQSSIAPEVGQAALIVGADDVEAPAHDAVAELAAELDSDVTAILAGIKGGDLAAAHLPEAVAAPVPVTAKVPVTVAEFAAALEADGVDPATAKALAELPPPVVSTPDEVAARRAERRERIAREKADGTRRADGSKRKPAKEPKAKKATKADAILELVSREGGASIPDICEATGWQRHTLRGYIAGTLRKRGHDIVRTSVDGMTGYALAKSAA